MKKTPKSKDKTLAAPSATAKIKEADSKNTPAFQNRKTIADYVKENMVQAGRKTFFQRVIVVSANREDLDLEDLKLKINMIADSCSKNLNHETVTGVYIFYKNYSVLMMEGSEQCVCWFMKGLADIEENLYTSAKILLVQNNINRVYFDSIFWVTENPPAFNKDELNIDNEDDAEKMQCDIVIQKIHNFCDLLRNKSSMHNQILCELPEIPRLEIILNCNVLLTVPQFANMHLKLTDCTDNDEKVWPIPYDHTPFGIFDSSKYNVNLTFSETDQK